MFNLLSKTKLLCLYTLPVLLFSALASHVFAANTALSSVDRYTQDIQRALATQNAQMEQQYYQNRANTERQLRMDITRNLPHTLLQTPSAPPPAFTPPQAGIKPAAPSTATPPSPPPVAATPVVKPAPSITKAPTTTTESNSASPNIFLPPSGSNKNTSPTESNMYK